MEGSPKEPVRLFWPWTLACGIGEFAGIGVAAAISIAGMRWIGEPDNLLTSLVTLLLAMVAGVIEGGITGYLQWRVLHKKFIAVRMEAWVGITSLGAAVAWLIGSLPATLNQFMASQASIPTPDPPPLFMAVLGAGMGIALGAFWGFWQWLVLRHHAFQAGKWVWANALGWMIGMPLIFLAASLPDESTPFFHILILAVAGGLLAGLTVGLVTGKYFVQLQPISYNEP